MKFWTHRQFMHGGVDSVQARFDEQEGGLRMASRRMERTQDQTLALAWPRF